MTRRPGSINPFTVLELGLFTVLLGYASLFLATAMAQWNADDPKSYYRYLFGAAVVGAICSLRWGPDRLAHPRDKVLFWLAVLLPLYVAFQCIPLPLSIIETLSPARAELLSALTPVAGIMSSSPLTVRISETTRYLFLFTSYMLVFFAAWQSAEDVTDKPWLAVAPILIVAIPQAAFGLSQAANGGFAHGVYPVRNHFAGFLEMAFPFAVGYTADAIARARSDGRVSVKAATIISLGSSAALLILFAAMYSLSRMGLFACFASLLVMALSALRGARRPILSGAVGLLAALVLLPLLAPPELVVRFASFESGRVSVWKDTLSLIRAYPVFGCGLGGYESALLRFKTSNLLLDQDYAHNDYLQFLAELGLIGFSIGVAFGITILLRLRSSLTAPEPSHRWLAIACAGSLTAILLHSIGDFNLYVPANATLLAWICGVAAAQSSQDSSSSCSVPGS